MKITHNRFKNNTEILGVDLNRANQVFVNMGIRQKGFIPVGGVKVHVKYKMSNKEKKEFRALYYGDKIEKNYIRGFGGCLITGFQLKFY